MGLHLTKTSKWLLGVIGILLFYGVIIMPLMRYWEDLSRRAEIGTLQYVRDREAVESAQVYGDTYKEMEMLVKQQRTNEEEFAQFLREVEQFAGKLAITMNTIKPLPSEEKGGSVHYYLEVEIESSIYDFVQYLYEIATSRSLIRVEKMHIAQKQFKNNVLSIRLVFSKTLLK